jgi:hypothetical protein
MFPLCLTIAMIMVCAALCALTVGVGEKDFLAGIASGWSDGKPPRQTPGEEVGPWLRLSTSMWHCKT